MGSFKFSIFHFSYQKISHTLKGLKAPKALKALKGTKTPRQKHKNANKQISDFFLVRAFKSISCYLCLSNFWIKKSKIALITSFILILKGGQGRGIGQIEFLDFIF